MVAYGYAGETRQDKQTSPQNHPQTDPAFTPGAVVNIPVLTHLVPASKRLPCPPSANIPVLHHRVG